MRNLVQDLRYAIRMLVKNPAFTLVAVITLALGIGANTAIFSVVNAVLLRPLPYQGSDRLITFWWGSNQQMFYPGPATVCDPDYTEWRDRSESLEDMAGLRGATANLTGVGEPARLTGWEVTASFFQLLGVEPAVGRAFSPAEEKPGQNRVVVLGARLWQSRFGSDRGAIGRNIKLDGQFYTVVGVMPRGFAFPNAADFWRPVELAPDCHNSSLRVMARLKRGATIQRARESVSAVDHNLAVEQHTKDNGIHPTIVRVQEELSANLRPSLLILLGAVGVVLLIACANVANLLLTRATARQKEVAIRRALGASRTRLMLQMLTECVLLALLGGGVGLMLASWGRDAVVSLMPKTWAQPGIMARLAEVNIDPWVLAFTVALSFVTSFVFGLAPAIQVSKIDLNESLKESCRASTASSGRRGLQSAFVVSEIAMALVLLIGAGVLIRSFVSLMNTDKGFDPQNVLTMNVSLPESHYQTEVQMVGFEEQAVERIEKLPGVRSAGVIFGLPLGGMWIRGDFTVESQPAPKLSPGKHVIGGDYFPAIGTRLLKGRYFDDHDTADRPHVAIINESMARLLWPRGDALGKRLKPGFSNDQWCTVVGVVADVKQFSLSEDEESAMAMYLPYAQAPNPFLMRDITFAVRTSGDPLRMAEQARHAIAAVDSDLPVFDVATMQELVYQSMSEPRFNTVLLAIFAALAFILATVGIYGVMSYTVTQRTHEIGVRMALGAERVDVLRLVVGQGMKLTLMGVVIGLGAAFGLTRLLASFLFGVQPTDPGTFFGVSILLAGVALVASYIPARRAMKVDPMVALRYE